MTTPVLTEDGKRLAEALLKARALPRSWIYWASNADALNTAAASLRLPLEGDASLREAVTAEMEAAALTAFYGSQDWRAPKRTKQHEKSARSDMRRALFAATAVSEPGRGPAAAGMGVEPFTVGWFRDLFAEPLWNIPHWQRDVLMAVTALARPQPEVKGPVAAGVDLDIPGDLIRRAYEHFQNDAEFPCSASAMREAVMLVLRATTPPAEVKTETDIEIERIGKGASVIFAHSEYDSEAHSVEEPLNGLVVVLDVDGSILSLEIEDLKADMTKPVEMPPAEAKTPDAATFYRNTLQQVRKTLTEPNPGITCTVWYDDITTLVDHIDQSLEFGPLTPTGSAGEDDTGVRMPVSPSDAVYHIAQPWFGASQFHFVEMWAAIRAVLAHQPPKAETPAGVGARPETTMEAFKAGHEVGLGEAHRIVMDTDGSGSAAYAITERLLAVTRGEKTAPAARPGDEVERVRHVKRGTEYEVLGEALERLSRAARMWFDERSPDASELGMALIAAEEALASASTTDGGAIR